MNANEIVVEGSARGSEVQSPAMTKGKKRVSIAK